MITLEAPYPLLTGTIYLPSQNWGDFKRQESSTVLKKSMNGQTQVTHNQVLDGTESLDLQIVMVREKALELREFFRAYAGEKMQMTLPGGTIHRGYLTVNPLSFEFVGKHNNTESVSVNLTFKGEK